MFCTNCGKNLPDGVAFCTECGAQLNRPQPVQPQQPVAYPARPVSKKEYIQNYASKQTKQKAFLALILSAVCLLTMVIGYFVTMNTSMEKIPVVSVIGTLADADMDEFDDMKDSMEDSMDELEDAFDKVDEDQFTKRERKLVENVIDSGKKFAKSFSISNAKKVIKSLDEIVKVGMEKELNLEGDVMELREAMTVLNTVSVVLLVMSLFSGVFTIAGGLTRITPLVAVGMVFSTINCMIFSGFLMVLLNLAAHIALIFFMTQVNKDYKTYRQSYRTAA